MAKTSKSGPENMHTLVKVLRCSLCIQRITFLRTYLTSLQLIGDWDCVTAVEHLTALHYSVDFIFLSFGIMGFIVKLKLSEGH